jgi:hypothetical protein
MLWNPLSPKPVPNETKPFIVTILYKSGNRVTGRFKTFKYEQTGTSFKLSWEHAPNKQYPNKPLMIFHNADDIEAIWYYEE